MINGAVTYATTPNAFIECQCRGVSAQPPVVKLGRAVNTVKRITSAVFFSRGDAELILKLCNQAGGYFADAFKTILRVGVASAHALKGDHVVIRGAWSPLKFIAAAHSVFSFWVRSFSVAGNKRNPRGFTCVQKSFANLQKAKS